MGPGPKYLTNCSFLPRSLMNVPFTIPKGADVEKQFLSEATREGMVSYRAAATLLMAHFVF